MRLNNRDRGLEQWLAALLFEAFPGIEIEAGFADRWQRPCVSFLWKGFAGLLPEERFQRLTTAIPEAVRKVRLAGFVWVELAPGERLDEVLALPRSEDVAKREPEIIKRLQRSGFFDSLARRLGKNPQKACPGDFSHTAAVLGENGPAAERIRDAKLVFIRHGAFCDCQVIQTVGPRLTATHT
jgi:hypothetical protein